MGLPAFVLCPRCRSTKLVSGGQQVRCTACGRTYPMQLGIVDFRDQEVDATAGFAFDVDRENAAYLAHAFDRVATFNELYQISSALWVRRGRGQDITKIELTQLLKEEGIGPRPMTPDQVVHGHAILEKIRQSVKTISRRMPKHQLALENGCGLGFFTDGLARNFDHLAVLDFSLAYLVLAKKIAQERGLTNLTFVCGSVERLPFHADTFDFIHSNNVIEHVSDQRAMFAEARRVLNREGLFYVQSPNRFSAYIEPHFALPFFGFIPKPISRRIIWKRQNRDISDVSLRSLGEVRRLASEQFGSNVHVSFIPRHLDRSVTGGTIRNLLLKGLNSPVLGGPTHLLVNRLLLGVMPYHVVLCFKQS